MASAEELTFNEPHAPHSNAIEAYNHVLHEIKSALIKSRHDWDKHEPRMWQRVSSLSDKELAHFTIEHDLIKIRSALSSYGTIILGKIRIPAVEDAYIHVRIHDPPNRGTSDIMFHSIFHEEVRTSEEEPPTDFRAVHHLDKPLEFFNE